MSLETRNALRSLTMSPDTLDALDEIAYMLVADGDLDLDLDEVDLVVSRERELVEIVSL